MVLHVNADLSDQERLQLFSTSYRQSPSSLAAPKICSKPGLGLWLGYPFSIQKSSLYWLLLICINCALYIAAIAVPEISIPFPFMFPCPSHTVDPAPFMNLGASQYTSSWWCCFLQSSGLPDSLWSILLNLHKWWIETPTQIGLTHRKCIASLKRKVQRKRWFQWYHQ